MFGLLPQGACEPPLAVLTVAGRASCGLTRRARSLQLSSGSRCQVSRLACCCHRPGAGGRAGNAARIHPAPGQPAHFQHRPPLTLSTRSFRGNRPDRTRGADHDNAERGCAPVLWLHAVHLQVLRLGSWRVRWVCSSSRQVSLGARLKHAPAVGLQCVKLCAHHVCAAPRMGRLSCSQAAALHAHVHNAAQLTGRTGSAVAAHSQWRGAVASDAAAAGAVAGHSLICRVAAQA